MTDEEEFRKRRRNGEGGKRKDVIENLSHKLF